MKKETNLCMSCMGVELPEKSAECPECGWIDTGVHLASYLFPRTLLSERYLVGKLTSYNGESAVYVGFDTLTEKKVTIKEYMPDSLCSREKEVLPLTVNPGELPLFKTYMSEFVELGRALQSFSTLPCIQRVIDVFPENNTAYIVMEYLDSAIPDYAAYLQSVGGVIKFEDAAELFLPLFSTIERINAAGIAHRAISPKTIKVSTVEGGDIPALCLTDFAIPAARNSDSKLTSEMFPGYAAPEQYGSLGKHGGWTDVYGIAAVLYLTLTGMPPLDAAARVDGKSLTMPKFLNDAIPDHISKSVMRGLEISYSNRVRSVGELSRLLWGVRKPSGTSPTTTATLPSLATLKSNVQEPQVSEIAAEIAKTEKLNTEQIEYEAQKQAELEERRLAKEKKRRIKLIVSLSSVCAIVMLFVFLIALANGGYFNPDPNSGDSTTPPPTTTAGTTAATTASTAEEDPVDECEVPNFVGLSHTAIHAEDFANLKLTFVPEFTDGMESPPAYGVVFEQSVAAKEFVPVGSEIIIKYSVGRGFVTMPTVEGQSVENLYNSLLALGVPASIISVQGVESPNFTVETSGMVVECNFATGQTVQIAYYPGVEGDPSRPAINSDRIIILHLVPMPVVPDPVPDPIPDPVPEPPPADPPAE